MRKVLLLGIVAGFLLFSAGVAFAGERMIVVFAEGTAPAEMDNIVLQNGGRVLGHLGIINGLVLTLPDKASDKAKAAILAHNKAVDLVVDGTVEALGKPDKPENPGGGKKPKPPPPQELPWGVDRIDAEYAWSSSTGVGIKVAVMDTGIDLDHPDLAVNVMGGYDTTGVGYYDDDNGHGTHCAGIIAALDNEEGVVGVAPQAHLYAVKVLDSGGSGYWSWIIAGLDWCVANNMQVASMSLGAKSGNSALHDAIVIAYNKGVVIVSSAGNSGPGEDTVGYPAKYEEVIAVSATGNVYRYRKYKILYPDEIANYSSRGPEVDIAAPGTYILSTYVDAGYKEMSGTSMACPHVAGAVALMLATVDRAVPADLYSTADDFGVLGKDDHYGWGILDAEEATTGAQTGDDLP